VTSSAICAWWGGRTCRPLDCVRRKPPGEWAETVRGLWARSAHPTACRSPSPARASLTPPHHHGSSAAAATTWHTRITQTDDFTRRPAHETTKHCTKFGSPPPSDVGAVTKLSRETRWNLLGCPKFANGSQLLVGRKFTVLWGHVEEILLFNKFFSTVDTFLSCEDIARQIGMMKSRRRIFASCISSEPHATHFRPAF